MRPSDCSPARGDAALPQRPMWRRAAWLAATLLLTASSAHAALKVGDPAPGFDLPAAVGGKTFDFALAPAIAKGPVVVYFYPKAFTKGCTIEAHLFAEASGEIAQMGASLIGISNDDIDTVKRFSVEGCRDKFPVAADRDSRVIGAYDAKMAAVLGVASRISYVVDKSGRIAGVHEGSKPEEHVQFALRTLRALQGR